MQGQYPHLFTPMEIRGHLYRNRILTGPTLFAEFIFNREYGENTYRMCERRAAGGAASVTTGELTLGDHNVLSTFQTDLDIDRLSGPAFEAFCQYAERIKKHGAVAMLELCHEGGDPADFSETRMSAVCDTLRRGAVFARACGFDGVLLHGGHGFLIQQFISPWTNHRTDDYGVSLENRAKFPKRVLSALREGLGEDGILELRLSAEDGVPDGLTIDETAAFCGMIDGMADILHISNGLKYKGNRTHTFTDAYDDHGYNIPCAAKVKAAVQKSKVAVIGGINDPQQCEEAIASGQVDFVILSRQAIADPDFPNKTKNGEADLIRRCIRCFNCYPGMPEHESEGPWAPPPPGASAPPFGLHSCFESPDPLKAMLESMESGGMNIGECTINPRANLRLYPEVFPAAQSVRKVLVVGGGPGGMEAAITAARRGHQVTLVERRDRLGGVLAIMEKDKDKADLYRFMQTQILELERSGTEVRLNCDEAEALIAGRAFDHVILAVGGVPRTPDIPGFETATDVAAATVRSEKLGRRVILLGSGLSGCETAIYLAKSGHEVTILARRDRMAPESTGFQRVAMLDEMDKCGVRQLTGHAVQEIYPDGVLVRTTEGAELRLYADSVVTAMGTIANPAAAGLRNLCAESGIPSALVGDCRRPGKVLEATRQGYTEAMRII